MPLAGTCLLPFHSLHYPIDFHYILGRPSSFQTLLFGLSFEFVLKQKALFPREHFNCPSLDHVRVHYISEGLMTQTAHLQEHTVASSKEGNLDPGAHGVEGRALWSDLDWNLGSQRFQL